jgi:hypothetical protein
MIRRECSHLAETSEAAHSGIWSRELELHREECLECAELAFVTAALTADAAELAATDAPIPDPGLIWLRGRLGSRERDLRRATRAIAWMQRAAVAAALALGIAFAPGLWRKIGSVAAAFDVHAPVGAVVRASGSPLVVLVASLMVLAALAFWELTLAHDA